LEQINGARRRSRRSWGAGSRRKTGQSGPREPSRIGVMEGHRLAQTVAYGDLGSQNPAPITPTYKRQAGPVIGLQLEKAGVRLAYLLNAAFK
jgi:hypothetical protein